MQDRSYMTPEKVRTINCSPLLSSDGSGVVLSPARQDMREPSTR